MGRQELAADRLQSEPAILVHPGHRELQPRHPRGDDAGQPETREFFTGGGPTNPFRITGSVTAIDVKTGKVAGKHETQFPLLGGMLATPTSSSPASPAAA